MTRDWDESEHPRHPARSPGGRGGEFRLGASAILHTMGGTLGEPWQIKVSRRLARGAYQPGAWEPMSTYDYQDHLYAELRRDLPEDVIDEMMVDWEWPTAVYRNGDHIASFSTPAMARHAPQVLAHLDELQARVPIQQQVRFATVPKRIIQGLGSAGPGTGIFFVAEEAFDGWPPVDEGRDVMPVAADGSIERWRYSMTHEWGHLVDPQEIPRTWRDDHARKAQDLMHDYADALTEYGTSDRMEGIAEAFAEWFLSRGRSTNEAARAYADWFGWRWE